MGYHKLITYILDTGAGHKSACCRLEMCGTSWRAALDGKRRPEVDLCPAQMKLRWEIGEEAALKEREAIQNVLDKQDKG